MKHLSLQWRITLLTALLIACACVCMNLLLYRTGVTGMDALNGFMMQYQPGSADSLTIEIPQEEMSSLLRKLLQRLQRSAADKISDGCAEDGDHGSDTPALAAKNHLCIVDFL